MTSRAILVALTLVGVAFVSTTAAAHITTDYWAPCPDDGNAHIHYGWGGGCISLPTARLQQPGVALLP